MNTIKIYLAESGRIADLRKDFPLYQYQYQSKLLNIYVPTSLLAPQFITEDAQGETIGEFVAGTAVKIGMRYLTRDGKIKVSQSKYLRYLKTLTYQGVEYALYERKLPQEFTFYAGQGQNAPTIVVNVVNVDTENNEIISLIPSQTCSLDVLPSADLDNDAPIEASDIEDIMAILSETEESLAQKQDKNDENIEKTYDSESQETWQDSQNVVGAINNNTAQTELNRQNIENNTGDIAQLTNDVDYLYSHISQPEEYIGQMTGSSLPTNAQLNAYVLSVADREPKNADVVIFVLQIAGETDKNYKYTYSVDNWNGYEIPPLEEASNGSLGLIEGTYSVGSTNNTLVDISGGKILNIYVKDGTNTYRNIREYLNTHETTINNISNGTTTVPKADSANKDGDNRNIVATYMTKSEGATKQDVRDYALPKTFNDVSFMVLDTSVSPARWIYANEPQIQTYYAEINTNSVGEHLMLSVEKTIENAEFELSNKNSYITTMNLYALSSCTIYCKLVTEVYINNEWVLLNAELTDAITFNANDLKKINFGSTLNSLNGVYLKIADGDIIRQSFYVITETSENLTFRTYGYNGINACTFYLNTSSYSQTLKTASKTEKGGVWAWEDENGFHIYLTEPPQIITPLTGNYEEADAGANPATFYLDTTNQTLTAQGQTMSYTVNGNELVFENVGTITVLSQTQLQVGFFGDKIFNYVEGQ